MLIIGITGPSGAGKTSALRAIESLGARTLDCDKIYHQLLADDRNLKLELDARFPGVFKEGVIDRGALGEIVFNDDAALADLNKIAHKYVDYAVMRSIDEWQDSGGAAAAVDAIALIESGLAQKCDVVVSIVAPIDARIQRIMTRDGITRERAELRVNAQKPESFFRENSDIILENVYDTPGEFENECKAVFTKLIGGYLPDEC